MNKKYKKSSKCVCHINVNGNDDMKKYHTNGHYVHNPIDLTGD